MKLRLLASGALVLGYLAWSTVRRAKTATSDCRVVKVVDRHAAADGRGAGVAIGV
jgi:hypothetical protein